MPKETPQRRIDTNAGGSGSSVFIGGQGSSAPASSHSHSEYLTQALADLRYYTQTQINAWKHDRLHTLDSTSDHDFSSWNSGEVLYGNGTDASIGKLAHSHLISVGENDHHAKQHSIIDASVHTITAPRFSVVGTPASADALTYWTAQEDGTGGHVLLKTDAAGAISLASLAVTGDIDADELTWTASTGQLKINPTSPTQDDAALSVVPNSVDDDTVSMRLIDGQTGNLIRLLDSEDTQLFVFDGEGNFETGNPSFIKGFTGSQINYRGDAEFNNLEARGTFRSSRTISGEQYAVDGSMVISGAGTAKLYEAFTISDEVPFDADDSSKPEITIRVENPESGKHYSEFAVNDILRIQTSVSPPLDTSPAVPSSKFWKVADADSAQLGTFIAAIWMQVVSQDDTNDNYQEYTVKVKESPACTVPKATVIVDKGYYNGIDNPTGQILLDADGNNDVPRMIISTLIGNEPWLSPENERAHVIMGLLGNSGAPFYQDEWGFKAGRDLNDPDEGFIKASTSGVGLYKVGITLQTGAGNTTGQITSTGKLEFGTDIYTTDNSGTGFFFDPVVQKKAWFGHYNPNSPTDGEYILFDMVTGRVTISDSVHIPFEAPATTWGSISGKPEDDLIFNSNITLSELSAELNALTEVPDSSGLYLYGNRLGFFDGANWNVWFSAIPGAPRMVLGDESGSRLQYFSNKLSGHNGAGVEQFYLSTTDGKIYAGAGALFLDVNGMTIDTETNEVGSIAAWGSANRITLEYDGRENGYIGGREYGSGSYQVNIAARGDTSTNWGTVLIQAAKADAPSWPGFQDGQLLVTPEHIAVTGNGMGIMTGAYSGTIPTARFRIFEVNGGDPDTADWVELYIDAGALKYKKSDLTTGTVVA